jgi:hypothetical protein
VKSVIGRLLWTTDNESGCFNFRLGLGKRFNALACIAISSFANASHSTYPAAVELQTSSSPSRLDFRLMAKAHGAMQLLRPVNVFRGHLAAGKKKVLPSIIETRHCS